MIKSCRKYWTKEIADSIVQLKDIRFVNPQMDVWTTFTREDYTRVLVEQFKLDRRTWWSVLRSPPRDEFLRQQSRDDREMLDRFFPGRDDVNRLLMEPIAYANGSTLDDPAITYGIVFLEFHGLGRLHVSRRLGPADRENGRGAEEERRRDAQKSAGRPNPGGRARRTESAPAGIVAGSGRVIRAKAVLSNANIKNTDLPARRAKKISRPISSLQAKAVRINTELVPGLPRHPERRNASRTSAISFSPRRLPKFSSDELTDFHTTSRTFSVYYPDTRPGSDRYTVVVSLNGRYADWRNSTEEDYETQKTRLIEESITALERFIPDVRAKIDWKEAATPRTIERYTTHFAGTSFGTKFEGSKSRWTCPKNCPGFYHAGAVGIIMSGWLGHDQLWRDHGEQDRPVPLPL